MENNSSIPFQERLITTISDMLKQSLGNTNTRSNNNNVQFIDAIISLTNAINRLSDTLDSLPSNLLGCNSSSSSKERRPSYAAVVRSSQVDNRYCTDNPTAQASLPPKNRASSSNQVAQPQNEFMSRLAELKNLRNEAYFRMRRNELVAKLYDDNLRCEPRRIPQKCIPNLVCHRDPTLLQHRNEMAIQAVEQEIKTMRLHQARQAKKMHDMDRLVNQHIETEEDTSKQEMLKSNYNRIISRSMESIEQRITKKLIFLASASHMKTLHEIAVHNSPEQSNVHEVYTSVVDQEMTTTQNQLKRPRSLTLSTESQLSNRRNSTLQPEFPQSQPLPKSTSHRHLLTTSKNCILLGRKGRIKKQRRK